MKFNVALVVTFFLAIQISAQTTEPVTDVVRPTCKLPEGNEVVYSDSVTATSANQRNDDTAVYAYVEEMPMFPGGDSAWRKYVANTMRYPDPTKCSVGCVQGTAYVRFVVEKDGSVTHVEVVKHPNSEYMKSEAQRIVEGSPNWIPGKQNGNVVRTSFVQPIRFMLY